MEHGWPDDADVPETQPSPRLLLVEDDVKLGPLVARGLAEAYEVTLVADGADAFPVARDGLFDVMVVDRRLPGLDGGTLVSRLRSYGVRTPILMLTALGSVGDKVEGLDLGANDYLVKPFEFDELLARLRALTRTFRADGDPIMIGEWEFYPRTAAIHSPYDGRITLTEREADLLRLLADNPEHTFSREQILAEVFTSGETLGSVDTYVHYLRKKIGRDVVETVRRHGYRLGRP